MSLLVVTVVALLVVGGAGGVGRVGSDYTFNPHPLLFPPPFPFLPVLSPLTHGSVIATRVVPGQEGPSLPCPSAGFHSHPTNCSRFYRCVDYVGTGLHFSLYLFECPQGHVFAPGAATCVPGPCPTPGPAPGPQPTEAPPQPTQAPPQPTQAPPQPTEAPPQPTEAPPQPTEAPPQPTEPPTDASQPPTEPPKPPTEAPQPPTEAPQPPTEAPQPPTEAPTTPSEGECRGQYLQHETHCNVYFRCNDTTQRFLCPPGTVFDQPRQMCRISAFDERLCEGKLVLPPGLLRTELVDGHLLLPADFDLPPLPLPLSAAPPQPPSSPLAPSPLFRIPLQAVPSPFLPPYYPPSGPLHAPTPYYYYNLF